MGLDMNFITNSKELSKVMSKYWAGEHYMEESCRKRGEIGYWRKFSALHNWMVTNVQYGEDDCGTYEVDADKLLKLYDVIKSCTDAIANFDVEDDEELVDMLDDMFPMTNGFFFNPTDAWDWHIGYIEETKKWFDMLFDNLYYDKEEHAFYFRDKETGKIDIDQEVRFWYNASW